MDKIYTFTIQISGTGYDAEEAWKDACEGFSMDPGICPEEFDEEDLDEYNDD